MTKPLPQGGDPRVRHGPRRTHRSAQRHATRVFVAAALAGMAAGAILYATVQDEPTPETKVEQEVRYIPAPVHVTTTARAPDTRDHEACELLKKEADRIVQNYKDVNALSSELLLIVEDMYAAANVSLGGDNEKINRLNERLGHLRNGGEVGSAMWQGSSYEDGLPELVNRCAG